jgi:hypothetical protein
LVSEKCASCGIGRRPLVAGGREVLEAASFQLAARVVGGERVHLARRQEHARRAPVLHATRDRVQVADHERAAAPRRVREAVEPGGVVGREADHARRDHVVEALLEGRAFAEADAAVEAADAARARVRFGTSHHGGRGIEGRQLRVAGGERGFDPDPAGAAAEVEDGLAVVRLAEERDVLAHPAEVRVAGLAGLAVPAAGVEVELRGGRAGESTCSRRFATMTTALRAMRSGLSARSLERLAPHGGRLATVDRADVQPRPERVAPAREVRVGRRRRDDRTHTVFSELARLLRWRRSCAAAIGSLELERPHREARTCAVGGDDGARSGDHVHGTRREPRSAKSGANSSGARSWGSGTAARDGSGARNYSSSRWRRRASLQRRRSATMNDSLAPSDRPTLAHRLEDGQQLRAEQHDADALDPGARSNVRAIEPSATCAASSHG